MADPDDSERLAQLEDRIARLKNKDAPKPHQEEHYSQAQLAWRMVIELVAGLAIGFAIGYGLDGLLGTTPAFLLVFTLLGLAAGIRTMMRSAQEVQQQQAGTAADDTPGEADADEAPGEADDERVKDGN